VVLTTFLEVMVWLVFAVFWVIVFGLFIWLFADIFRRRDLSGWGKAGWIFFVFVLPLIGALIYMIARPSSADYEREGVIGWAPQPGSSMSPAEEVAYAKQLLDQGSITQAEFDEIKAKTI
jgi:hypothetical protein